MHRRSLPKAVWCYFPRIRNTIGIPVNRKLTFPLNRSVTGSRSLRDFPTDPVTLNYGPTNDFGYERNSEWLWMHSLPAKEQHHRLGRYPGLRLAVASNPTGLPNRRFSKLPLPEKRDFPSLFGASHLPVGRVLGHSAHSCGAAMDSNHLPYVKMKYDTSAYKLTILANRVPTPAVTSGRAICVYLLIGIH